MIDPLWQDNKTELNTHPFLRSFDDRISDLYGRDKGAWNHGQGSLIDTLRASDKYSGADIFSIEMHFILQEVNFKIDRVQQCSTMLDFYPTNMSTAWFTPMTRCEYLEQIIELYIMHSIGLLDRVLITYNFLFDLRLERRERTMENIVKKLPEDDGFPLYCFAHMFEGIKKSRNAIAHESRYIDAGLLRLGIQDSIARDGYRLSMPDARRIFRDINKQYDKKMRSIYANMQKDDELLTERYLSLLEVFERQFNKRLALLN